MTTCIVIFIVFRNQEQKAAIVTPLIRKRGLDKADRKNYWPASSLTFVSKLLERVVCNQMTDFLEANDALPVTQSAYRRFHIPCQRYTLNSVWLSAGGTDHFCSYWIWARHLHGRLRHSVKAAARLVWNTWNTSCVTHILHHSLCSNCDFQSVQI